MRVGPHAAHIGRIDEMRAVGALDRKPRRGSRAGRLAEAAKRRRRQPREAGGRACGGKRRLGRGNSGFRHRIRW